MLNSRLFQPQGLLACSLFSRALQAKDVESRLYYQREKNDNFVLYVYAIISPKTNVKQQGPREYQRLRKKILTTEV